MRPCFILHEEACAFSALTVFPSDYVPLLRRAYTLWDELKKTRDDVLFVRCGLLYVGNEQGIIMKEVKASATTHGLELERITPKDVAYRFPGFIVPDDFVA